MYYAYQLLIKMLAKLNSCILWADEICRRWFHNILGNRTRLWCNSQACVWWNRSWNGYSIWGGSVRGGKHYKSHDKSYLFPIFINFVSHDFFFFFLLSTSAFLLIKYKISLPCSNNLMNFVISDWYWLQQVISSYVTCFNSSLTYLWLL